MVMKTDDNVWATGSNVHGQLGDGSTTDRNTFVKVTSSGMKAMAAGFGHSMVLTKDDSLWATGWNLYGQFGDGSITSTSKFVRVAKLSDTAVSDALVRAENFKPSDLSVTTIASPSGESPSFSMFCCAVHVFLTPLFRVALSINNYNMLF